MVAADRRASIERADNGWTLVYWSRERATMTERREVFTAFPALVRRLAEVFGPVDLHQDDGA